MFLEDMTQNLGWHFTVTLKKYKIYNKIKLYNKAAINIHKGNAETQTTSISSTTCIKYHISLTKIGQDRANDNLYHNSFTRQSKLSISLRIQQRSTIPLAKQTTSAGGSLKLKK